MALWAAGGPRFCYTSRIVLVAMGTAWLVGNRALGLAAATKQ